MTDLSDAEWLKALRLEYGDDHICLYRPQDGGHPWRSAAEWEALGVMGVYLK